MCQDVDHHIRISACQQLAAIARIAGKDVTAKTILPELFELLNDESLEVRAPRAAPYRHQHGCTATCARAGRPRTTGVHA